MKKNLLLVLLLSLISLPAISQKVDKKTEEILAEFEEMKKNFSESENEWVFTRIISVDSISKDDLYTKCLELLAEFYKDSKDVIQNKDKEAGVIVGKGLFISDYRNINWATIARSQCYHIMKINVKDGRCRISITINSIMLDQGSDLRNSTGGTEHSLKEFYPYWEKCKPKHRRHSFDNLKFVYDEALAALNYFESKLKTYAPDDDNW